MSSKLLGEIRDLGLGEGGGRGRVENGGYKQRRRRPREQHLIQRQQSRSDGCPLQRLKIVAK